MTSPSSPLLTAAASVIVGVASLLLTGPAPAGVCLSDLDTDGDGYEDCVDNCPLVVNDQTDRDGNGVGDDCECGVEIDTTEDGDDGECVVDCTLREAIALAPSSCTLPVPEGEYGLTMGLIDIEREVALVGVGVGATILQGGFKVFLDDFEEEVYIGTMTLRDYSHGALIWSNFNTHVVLNNLDMENAPLRLGNPYCCYGDTVTLQSSTVRDTVGKPGVVVQGFEAGLGTLIARDSSFVNNSSGAIDVAGSGFSPLQSGWGYASLTRCTISGNSAYAGAGIVARGPNMFGGPSGRVDLIRSTVDSNTATDAGGGIYLRPGELIGGGYVKIVDSTISGNSAEQGGGIYNLHGSVELIDATIHENEATAGGGGIVIDGNGAVEVGNTIIAGNLGGTGEADCAGVLTGTGYNLIGDVTGCVLAGSTSGNVTGVDPGLGPLQDNGGATSTHAPLAVSPVLDAGGGCEDFDQRGVARPLGAACDIGSVELTSVVSVQLDFEDYSCVDVVGITVFDGSPPAGPLSVSVSSDSEPVAEIVELTDVGEGLFTGSILLTPSSPPVAGDGLLSVADGDTVLAEYVDEDAGSGGENIPYQAAATVHCAGPIISDVDATIVGDTNAHITWTTDEPATSLVRYGLTPPGSQTVSSEALVTEHSLIAQGLLCTEYVFSVTSEDEFGNSTTDDNGGEYYTFERECTVPPIPDGSGGTLPVRAEVLHSGIKVHWSNECATAKAKFVYGPLDQVSSYVTSGEICDVPEVLGSLVWTSIPDESSWFLVLRDNGLGMESSWGEATSGERNGALPSGTCGSVSKDMESSCP